MTTEDLHKILNNKKYKLSSEELKEIIFQLKLDTRDELLKSDISNRDTAWYQGEGNGFQVVLDLLDHLKEK